MLSPVAMRLALSLVCLALQSHVMLSAKSGFVWQVRSIKQASDLLSCFCRQVMKESKGRVNPAVMNKILMQKLKGS